MVVRLDIANMIDSPSSEDQSLSTSELLPMKLRECVYVAVTSFYLVLRKFMPVVLPLMEYCGAIWGPDMLPSCR
jgi:hypothetical protein